MEIGLMKKFALAVLSLITTGLVGTVYGIFTEDIPRMKTDIKILEKLDDRQEEILKKIDEKVTRVGDRTQKIYEILLEKNK